MGKATELKNIEISKLKPYENNAKIHGRTQIDLLKKSIEEFGFVSPCLIDADYNLIAGHGRVTAAKEMGMTEVPCLFIEGLTETQRRAYILADNKMTELGEWDEDILTKELESLKDIGFDINLTGFSIDDIDIGDIDFTDIDQKWNEDNPNGYLGGESRNIRKGQVWKLGNHRLMCGDSTKTEDVLKLMGGETADLFLTDPPYNVDYAGKNETLNLIDKGSRIQKDIENDLMTDNAFENFLTDAFYAANNFLKEGGVFYLWHSDFSRKQFISAIEKIGWISRETLIWVKNQFVIGRQDYHHRYEPCLYGWKDGAGHYFIDDRTQDDVFDITKIDDMNEEELRSYVKDLIEKSTIIYERKPAISDLHPTMKPINLFKRLIVNSSREGENVLDLFGGSGTTIIAAEQTNRKAFVMELDPEYVEATIQRWEQFTGEKAELIEEGE